MLGDGPQGDTLQLGVLHRFPQGLLARRCLPGWRSVRGGGVLIIQRLVGLCSQSGQALKLQPGETMLAQVPHHPGQFGSRSLSPLCGPQRPRLGRSFLVGNQFPVMLDHKLSVAPLQHLHLDTGIAGAVLGWKQL